MISALRACRTLSTLNFFFFFFNDTATTEIYTLSLHDALPIYDLGHRLGVARGDGDRSQAGPLRQRQSRRLPHSGEDRKSTRLNSSHLVISYAVFCLKKKTIPSTVATPSRQYHASDHRLLPRNA